VKFKRIVTAIMILSTSLFLVACSNISIRQNANSMDNWTRIKKRGYVIIGVDDTFVPMSFRQKNGKLVGYDIDLATAVFKLYGLKVSFQTIDWSMNTTELRNGTIDLIWNGFSKTPSRANKVAFSQTYLNSTQVLVSLKTNKLVRPASLKNKALGVQTGSSGYNDVINYPNIYKKQIKNHYPILYDSFTNAFIDLNSQRIQGLLLDSTYANYYISHQKEPDRFFEIQSPFPKEEFAVGLRKSDIILRQKINHALIKLAKEQTIARIDYKWFKNRIHSPLTQKFT
jgi:polar amino acid transport system substrate-binding protein